MTKLEDLALDALLFMLAFIWITSDFWYAVISRIRYGRIKPDAVLLVRARDLADAAVTLLSEYDETGVILNPTIEDLRTAMNRFNEEDEEE